MDPIFALVRNIVNVKYSDIPVAAVDAAKKDILDVLGVAIGGSTAPGCKEVVDLVKEWGGKEESTIIVYGDKVPSVNAALANATMAHALDYEDTHDAGTLHAGGSIVPAAFAIAERMGKLSGQEFIAAVTLGTDLLCRMGLATTVSAPVSGWMYTAVYGYFGAAAAASRILGLNEDRTVHALGIAYAQAAGNEQCIYDGALSKRLQVGFAAKAGVTAALMAEKGLTGAQSSLEGRSGFYNVYLHGAYDATRLTAELGKRFEGVNLSFKPYPCCSFNHPYIDATLQLVREHNIRPDDVQSVTALVGEATHRVLCEPLEAKKPPRTVVDAQFSLPYTIATAIVKRKVTIGDFTNAGINDSTVLEIVQKVTPRLEPSLSQRALSPAIVEIRVKGKKEAYSKRVDFQFGHPRNPMSMEDISNKFRDCVKYSAKPIPKETVENTIAMVHGLEKLGDANEILVGLR